MKIELILVLMVILIPLGIAPSGFSPSANDHFIIVNRFEQNGTKIQQIMLPLNGSSMSPNLKSGDVIIVENLERVGTTT